MKLTSKIFKRVEWYITFKFGYREPINTKKEQRQYFIMDVTMVLMDKRENNMQ